MYIRLVLLTSGILRRIHLVGIVVEMMEIHQKFVNCNTKLEYNHRNLHLCRRPHLHMLKQII
jgi:hypothetical protein